MSFLRVVGRSRSCPRSWRLMPSLEIRRVVYSKEMEDMIFSSIREMGPGERILAYINGGMSTLIVIRQTIWFTLGV